MNTIQSLERLCEQYPIYVKEMLNDKLRNGIFRISPNRNRAQYFSYNGRFARRSPAIYPLATPIYFADDKTDDKISSERHLFFGGARLEHLAIRPYLKKEYEKEYARNKDGRIQYSDKNEPIKVLKLDENGNSQVIRAFPCAHISIALRQENKNWEYSFTLPAWLQPEKMNMLRVGEKYSLLLETHGDRVLDISAAYTAKRPLQPLWYKRTN